MPVGLAVAGLGTAGGGQAPQDDQKLRVEVPLVNVSATVRAGNGRYITDLTAEDFAVYEDGVRQPITHFSAGEEAPATLLLALDTSRSQEKVFETQRDAAIELVRRVVTPGRKALLLTFDLDVVLVQGATSDTDLLVSKLKEVQVSSGMPRRFNRRPARGGTHLLDAVYASTRTLSSEQTRKAIVLFSDGIEDGSVDDPEKVSQEAVRQDVAVYGVRIANRSYYGQPFSRQSDWALRDGSKRMKDLAESTGGVAFITDDPKEVRAAIDQIEQELRYQYWLAYRPANQIHDGKFRLIEVKVSRPQTKVRARSGYFAPPPTN
ncbi:MAG: VWA domain-containing protein [Candidatus Acidiferrales bacterium]